jgi:hypothetical protein
MNRLFKRMTCALGAFLAVAVASRTALAGDHQICFQDQLDKNGNITAIFACRSDSPGITCSIDPQGLHGVWGWTPAGQVEIVTLPMSGTYTANISFSDGTLRTCTVSALDPSLGAGAPSSGASLFGYTTDASGLLMTGVWTHRSNLNAEQVYQKMRVPWDMVAVGGGVVGAELPSGALVNESQGTLDPREWQVLTSDLVNPQPHENDAYVIGLKIEGADQPLSSLVTSRSAVTDPNTPLDMPSITQAVPGGTIALGGGIRGLDRTGHGQFATASFPNVKQAYSCAPSCEQPLYVGGWTDTTKDHLVSAPGEVYVDVHAIAGQFTIRGATFHVVGSVSAATSGLASHPAIAVAGQPGFALTGIGAYVDWQTYGSAGNLIWKLKPRPDIAGAEVASKDHDLASPATITGYALGVKLVAGPVPAPRSPKPILP